MFAEESRVTADSGIPGACFTSYVSLGKFSSFLNASVSFLHLSWALVAAIKVVTEVINLQWTQSVADTGEHVRNTY